MINALIYVDSHLCVRSGNSFLRFLKCKLRFPAFPFPVGLFRPDEKGLFQLCNSSLRRAYPEIQVCVRSNFPSHVRSSKSFTEKGHTELASEPFFHPFSCCLRKLESVISKTTLARVYARKKKENKKRLQPRLRRRLPMVTILADANVTVVTR